MVKCQLPKLNTGVRFPSPAPAGWASVLIRKYQDSCPALFYKLKRGWNGILRYPEN